MKSSQQIRDKLKDLFEQWLEEDNQFMMREISGWKAALRWVLE